MYNNATSASSITGILVVRLSAMGDVIHALPAVASLKHSFPGSHLTWVVEPKWAPLLEGNVFVDRVVELDRRSPGGLLRAWRELRARRYDLAVDFQGLIKSALVASAARPERIFGFHHSQVRERLAALCYSNRTISTSAHAVERYLDLAAAAGAGSIVRTFPIPPGSPEGSPPPEPFVLACPLAGWRGKQWPLEYYGRLARLLRAEWGMPLIVTGPPGAREALGGIEEAPFFPTSLIGLIWLTRQAVAVVGVDSGPLHLAAALGKCGVAIYGPTDPARNGPYGGSIAVLRSPNAVTTYKRASAIDPSMRAISPEAVFQALRERFGRSASAGRHAR
jgi:heptosyltransferase-1